MGYDADLPVEIPAANPGKRYAIPFFIGDDVETVADRIKQIKLRMQINNLVSVDRLAVRLNGESLEHEACLRGTPTGINHYDAQILEFTLQGVRPRRSPNKLEISLEYRPRNLVDGVSIENVEVYIEYGFYATGLYT